MNFRSKHVCPAEYAGCLDIRAKRWVQDPRKILAPYLEEGMTALDLGCGPGFFTVEMARMVGKTGRVIASDLQEGMLQRLKRKLVGTELEGRIQLHKCQESSIGVPAGIDFVLAFYMVHEVPDRARFFREIASIVKPTGRVLVVEPPLHVSKKAFEEMIETARNAGLIPVERPNMAFSKAVVLKKELE